MTEPTQTHVSARAATNDSSAAAAEPLYGVNLPWLFGAYGHDLAPNGRLEGWPCDFDTFSAYRPLVESQDLGFSAVRIWLCENGEGIFTHEGSIKGVDRKLLDAVGIVQEALQLLGLRAYWTFLDGNSWQREKDDLTASIFKQRDQTERFCEHVVRPVMAALDPRLTLAVEVVNEPEALVAECLPAGCADQPIAWEEIGRTVGIVGDCVRAERPGTMVTAGTLHVFLPKLWRSGARMDAVDIHNYHSTGGLPSRQDLARYVEDTRLLDPSLPLFAGECGIPDDAPAAALESLVHYVHNARSGGYDAAFVWRLEQVLVEPNEPGRPVTHVGKMVRKALAAVRSG